MNRKRSTNIFKLIGSRLSFERSSFLHLADGSESTIGQEAEQGEYALTNGTPENGNLGQQAEEVRDSLCENTASSSSKVASIYRFDASRKRESSEAGLSPTHFFRSSANDITRTTDASDSSASIQSPSKRRGKTNPTIKGKPRRARVAQGKDGREKKGRSYGEFPFEPTDLGRRPLVTGGHHRTERCLNERCRKLGHNFPNAGRAAKVVAALMVEGKSSPRIERFTQPNLTRFHLLKFPN